MRSRKEEKKVRRKLDMKRNENRWENAKSYIEYYEFSESRKVIGSRRDDKKMKTRKSDMRRKENR